MGSVIVVIDLITRIVQKLNLTIPEGLVLYRTLSGLRTQDYPELDDAAVIDLFRQRADAGIEWVGAELARLEMEPPVD